MKISFWNKLSLFRKSIIISLIFCGLFLYVPILFMILFSADVFSLQYLGSIFIFGARIVLAPVSFFSSVIDDENGIVAIIILLFIPLFWACIIWLIARAVKTIKLDVGLRGCEGKR